MGWNRDGRVARVLVGGAAICVGVRAPPTSCVRSLDDDLVEELGFAGPVVESGAPADRGTADVDARQEVAALAAAGAAPRSLWCRRVDNQPLTIGVARVDPEARNNTTDAISRGRPISRRAITHSTCAFTSAGSTASIPTAAVLPGAGGCVSRDGAALQCGGDLSRG